MEKNIRYNIDRARKAQQEHAQKHDVQMEMHEFNHQAHLYAWYCEHGFYQGFDCPDCDVPSYYPSFVGRR